jgi:beta propeller repeat protein
LNRAKLFWSAAIILLAVILCGGLRVDPAYATVGFRFVESPLTSDSAAQENPDIYQYGLNNYAVVWQDNRNGNWDIYMYYQNYLGGSSWDVRRDVRLTTNPGNDQNPKIYGDLVVYQSDRNGNWDIYIYNLTSKVETQITNDPATQSSPTIYGNAIAWQDARNATWNGNYLAYYPWSIYMFNLTTQTEQRISRQNEDCFSPAISDSKLTYLKEVFTYIQGSGVYSGGYDYSPYVCSYDLSTGKETDVHTVQSLLIPVSRPNYIQSPAISGTSIVWTMDEPYQSGLNVEIRDVATGANWKLTPGGKDQPDISVSLPYTYIVYTDNRDGNSEIYMNELSTGTESRVTYNSATQSKPAISTGAANFIVYMDNRNGNWDIYITSFWLTAAVTGKGPVGVTGTGPSSNHSPSPTSTLATEKTVNSDNQRLIIIAISAAIIIAIVGAAAFLVKQRKPRKPNN